MAKKILMIDDDSDFTEATASLLRAKGFTVDTAPDGKKGAAQAHAAVPPDLIVLDVMMTYDSEGLDMASKLAGDPVTRAIPILLVTGIRHPEDLPMQSASVKGCLEKPVRPDEFLKAIGNVLGC